MERIIEYQIPITNYERTGVFMQSVYVRVNGRRTPTKEDLLKILREYHEEDSQYHEYLGDWTEAIQVVESAKEFPIVHTSLVGTNTFVQHPKWGQQPLSAKEIEVYNL